MSPVAVSVTSLDAVTAPVTPSAPVVVIAKVPELNIPSVGIGFAFVSATVLPVDPVRIAALNVVGTQAVVVHERACAHTEHRRSDVNRKGAITEDRQIPI